MSSSIKRMTQISALTTNRCTRSWFFSFSMTFLVAIIVLSSAAGRALALPEQKSFSSPQQAITALVVAIEKGNDNDLLSILGPASEALIASGDKVADQNGKARFLQAYQEKHSLEHESEGLVTFLIGGKNYPFPIPIVRQGDLWFFDTQTGMEEILNRRIGRNELHTIEVMQAYTEAQREYAGMIRDEGVPTFAQKLYSSEGKRDGLYWETTEGEKESPFGPLVARAAKKGYATELDEESPVPFRGYYFKILKSQGEHASGGAFDYVIDDKMILGFALVAYPAKYAASGVMTFIVNQEGVVYEKDLGEETDMLAAAMTSFDPDGTWRKYTESTGP